MALMESRAVLAARQLVLPFTHTSFQGSGPPRLTVLAGCCPLRQTPRARSLGSDRALGSRCARGELNPHALSGTRT
jgi:hypothetical protein